MVARGSKMVAGGVGVLVVVLVFMVGLAMGADPIVGEWNYATSNHWAKGPVPPGEPS